MCDVYEETRFVSKKPRRAWKVVRKGRKSGSALAHRPYLGGYPRTYGKVLTYTKGRVIKSPDGPGVMVYIYRTHAENDLIPGIYSLIEVLIPAGVSCVRGDYGCPILCVGKVKVIS